MSQQEFNLEMASGAIQLAMSKAKKSDLWKVAIGDIHIIEGFNPRVNNDDYKQKIRELADSMKANGFYQDKPLAVFVSKDGKKHRVSLIDGHTRLEAAKLANTEGAEITHLPVVTKPNGTSMEDLTISLVTSNSGQALTPYETGVVCKRLIGYGMTEAEIAKRLSVSGTMVKNYLTTVAAPKAIRDLVMNGKVSATLASETIRKHGTGASNILKAAVSEAKAEGRQRITPKAVRRGKRDLFTEGSQWITENVALGSYKSSIELLAFLCDVESSEIMAQINELRLKAKQEGRDLRLVKR